MRPTFADPPRGRRGERLWQLGIAALVCGCVAAIGVQTSVNLRARGIATGFGYLGRTAGFEIAPGPMPYSSRDTNAHALAVGAVNTVRLAVPGILAAGALGLAIGVARVSSCSSVAAAARIYVDTLRSVPLLLQILCWAALLQRFPAAGTLWRSIAGVTLTNREISLGITMSPEFAALLGALSTYTAAFIAENVRGGIAAVARGQKDAAAALGLSRLQALRTVVLPQALPVIAPPTISQFVNLMKNSSLAAAIGYADLMSVTSTTVNQTGQAVEGTALAMAFYLGASLAIAAGARVLLRRGRAH